MSAIPTAPDHTDGPRQRIHDRLITMKVLTIGSVLAIVVLAAFSFALILPTQARLGDIAVFSYGLVCWIGAFVFMVAAGTLFGHHAAAETQLYMTHHLDERLDRLDARIDWLTQAEERTSVLLERILEAGNELDARRNPTSRSAGPGQP